MEIANARILITGASRGVGRHLAVHFAQRGARPFLTARGEAGLRETAALAEEAGGRACSYHVCDLRVRETVAGLVERVREEAVGVDVLINNAADVTSKPLLETSAEEIESLILTNVAGCLQLCRLVGPLMVAQGRGMIVNVSSLAGYKPNPGQTVYSVSKAAVNGISAALRADFGGQGVAVMNVALASVGLGERLRRGEVPVARFAARLERAIVKEETELFLSPLTKWLMRLYGICPGLARLR